MPRVALVTGGTRGIGSSTAIALKKNGYTTVVTYHGNDEAAKDFEKAHNIPAYRWDVGSFGACQEGMKKVEKDIGPIDILVNNAGITRDGFLHKMTPQMWNDVIQTNLSSCFNMCRLVIEKMRSRQYGRIINISSINGLKGQAGQTNYSAAKAGIIGFTKALALESAGKGVTVNAIAPGYIDTDMVRFIPEKILNQIIETIPIKRLGTTDDISRAVLFLVDENAGFITGSTLNVNGGLYMA